MKTVLNALAFAMPEVGYCQGNFKLRIGMNFIVGTLLLKLDEE